MTPVRTPAPRSFNAKLLSAAELLCPFGTKKLHNGPYSRHEFAAEFRHLILLSTKNIFDRNRKRKIKNQGMTEPTEINGGNTEI